MNIIVFLLSTCLLLGVVSHAIYLVIKENNLLLAIENKSISEYDTVDYDESLSPYELEKSLLYRKTVNKIGLVLGWLAIIVIIAIFGERILQVLMTV